VIISYEKMYEGPNLSGATPGVITVFVPKPGDLVKLAVQVPGGSWSGNWRWGVRYNGADLLTGIGSGSSNLITTTQSAKLVERSVDVDVVKGGKLELYLHTSGTGTMPSPIAFYFDLRSEAGTDQDIQIVTEELDQDETGVGTVALGKDFKLKRLELSGYGRFRLYKTAAARTLDLARPFGDRSYRGEQHQMICDIRLTSEDGLAWYPSPPILGDNADEPPTEDIYWAIQNETGGAAVMTADLVYIKEQE
jgi:hypothetical protein